MPRPSAVWINTRSLAVATDYARKAGATDAELLGAERALAAAERAESGRNWRFTMLMQAGYLAIQDLIYEHAPPRRLKYTVRVFDWLVGSADANGLYLFEPDELAARLRVPRNALYNVLIDLEAEPYAAITRLRKGRQLRGIALTSKVHRKAPPKPGRRNGTGRGRAAAASASAPS